MAGDDKKPSPPAATIMVPGAGLPPATSAPASAAGATAGYRPIQPGDILNHIFEVKRFIARGGMGEVFEGINVASDERVAIKVMLPSMSADEKTLAMFRKEARTLTRLNHPALVQYRVLAQEPQLGVVYIVTDFVDGRNLSDVLGELEPTPQDLVSLIRRLASGLQAAHALGAIHRDMSPDNVMLEGGVLAGARIIDFGIAKDLDPSSATIIGDGFAGKLNYVAPEQLGDFDRTIGPWTDIYSLGLTILAVAGRKDVDMGTTMVNAVDRRRAGPDLSAAPEELRELLSSMLKANPQERVRSMGDLLGLLPVIDDRRSVESGEKTEQGRAASPVDSSPPEAVEPAAAPEPEAAPAPVEPTPAEPIDPVEPALDKAVQMETPVPVGEPVENETQIEPDVPAAVEAPQVVAETSTEAPAEPEQADWGAIPVADAPAISEPPRTDPIPATPPERPVRAIQTAVPAKSGNKALPILLGVGAVLLLIAAGAWYVLFSGKVGGSASSESAQVIPISDQTAPTRAALAVGLPSIGCTWLDIAGVTQKGANAVVALRGVAGKPDEAKAQIASLLAAKNLKGDIDMRDVATIEASECGPLDTLRQIRDAAGTRMNVEQPKIEMAQQTSGNLAGSVGATAVVDFNLGDPGQEMSLFGVEPSGKISQLTTERAELVGASTDMGGNRYRLPIDVNHTGWSGLILLTGQKPFDGALLEGPPGSRTGDWSQRFIAAAKERGWKAEMVWFNAVNEQPD
jgi:serine/threonine protein kinase